MFPLASVNQVMGRRAEFIRPSLLISLKRKICKNESIMFGILYVRKTTECGKGGAKKNVKI